MTTPDSTSIVMLRTCRHRSFAPIGAEVARQADAARVRFARAVARPSQKLRAFDRGGFDEFLA